MYTVARDRLRSRLERCLPDAAQQFAGRCHRQPIYQNSVARWRRYEPWLGELRDLVPDAGSYLMDIDSRYVAGPGQHSTQGTGTPMDLSLACARLARAFRPSR